MGNGIQINLDDESQFKGYVVRALQGIDTDITQIEKVLKELSDAIITIKLKIALVGIFFGFVGAILGNIIVKVLSAKLGI